MKKIQLVLAYYSIIVSTSLLVWALFISQNPQSLLLAFLFFPCGLYFWLTSVKIFKVETNGENIHKHLSLVLLATLAVSISAFIYAAVLVNSNTFNSFLLSASSKDKGMSLNYTQDLENINSRLSKIEEGISKNSPTTVPTATPTKEKLKTITLANQSQTPVNIFESKATSSGVLAVAEFGKAYFVLEKDPSWYRILVNNREGYIEASQVKETLY